MRRRAAQTLYKRSDYFFTAESGTTSPFACAYYLSGTLRLAPNDVCSICLVRSLSWSSTSLLWLLSYNTKVACRPQDGSTAYSRSHCSVPSTILLGRAPHVMMSTAITCVRTDGRYAVWERKRWLSENEITCKRINGEPRTPGSTAAIINKKRFVREKFCPCTCSYV